MDRNTDEYFLYNVKLEEKKLNGFIIKFVTSMIKAEPNSLLHILFGNFEAITVIFLKRSFMRHTGSEIFSSLTYKKF